MRSTLCKFIIFSIAGVLVLSATAGSAAAKPVTAAELALYQGADRQQILEEGARKEGKLTFYTTGILTQSVRPFVDAFKKKYPYIKVEIWRAGTNKLIPRVMEEISAGRHIVDVIELPQSGQVLLQESQILQPFYSPNLVHIEKGVIKAAPGGHAFSVGHWQSGISLGYNTKIISRQALPKTHHDLLDPKWKGKIPIPTSGTGISWAGACFEAYGEEFLKKASQQNFVAHAISGRALLDMIIAGEYEFSPTVFDSHVRKSKSKGAPLDWIPLEPVLCFTDHIMMSKYVAHPHAALLFIDFDLSKQAGEIYKMNGYNSPRKDVSVEREYKKYHGPFSSDQAKLWNSLFNKYFLKK